MLDANITPVTAITGVGGVICAIPIETNILEHNIPPPYATQPAVFTFFQSSFSDWAFAAISGVEIVVISIALTPRGSEGIW